MEAMLLLAGEGGYRHATLARVCARAGIGSRAFYAHFAGKSECFAAAHAAEVEPLAETLLDVVAAQPDSRAALRAVLAELFGFIAARPLIARAVLREVYVAGGVALVKHEEVLERLSGALAGACRETIGSRHSPPPISASFMVGAIEESVRARLSAAESEPDPRTLMPELVRVLAGPFSAA